MRKDKFRKDILGKGSRKPAPVAREGWRGGFVTPAEALQLEVKLDAAVNKLLRPDSTIRNTVIQTPAGPVPDTHNLARRAKVEREIADTLTLLGSFHVKGQTARVRETVGTALPVAGKVFVRKAA